MKRFKAEFHNAFAPDEHPFFIFIPTIVLNTDGMETTIATGWLFWGLTFTWKLK